jgi:putative effector of murein hydrolase
MLSGILIILAFAAMFVGYVTRERLFFIADDDPVASEIIAEAHVATNLLWIPLYRHRRRIRESLRRMVLIYFWSSFLATVFFIAALAAYWLAA